jgi:uncharacterized membrane protein YgdD (TMEM256/DUF423 family)
MWLRIAALLGFAGVAMGAFGAHAAAPRISPQALDVYRTGVLYHLVHAVALLAVALGGPRVRRAGVVCALFAGGIGVFSGTLYLLALTGARWLGAITPIGGVAFLAGWMVLAAGAGTPYTTENSSRTGKGGSS